MPLYKAAIEQAGGEPVEVPLDLDNHGIARLAASCDGVLLPGSRADVNPEKYEAVRGPHTADADSARDNVDELLLQDAYHMRKPVLGICFGIQMLNVWRSGTLVQHIDTAVLHGVSGETRHPVEIAPASRLAEIIGVDKADSRIEVNSSHHQAVERVGDGLRVAARCPQDGVIEAIEGTAPNHFVLGVQWHPERTFSHASPSGEAAGSHASPAGGAAGDSVSQAIFRAFVEAARHPSR